MVREVASKTSDVRRRDHTATVLAEKIYREGLKYVSSGANATLVKKGIDGAVEKVVESLKTMKRDVKGTMIAQVGSISANNDMEIGKIIADAMDKVGKDGVITVEEAKSLETTLEFVEGCSLTAVTSPPTSSPTPTGWSALSRIPSSSSTKRRSPP